VVKIFVKELLFGAKVQKNITKTINAKFGIFYDIYLRPLQNLNSTFQTIKKCFIGIIFLDCSKKQTKKRGYF